MLMLQSYRVAWLAPLSKCNYMLRWHGQHDVFKFTVAISSLIVCYNVCKNVWCSTIIVSNSHKIYFICHAAVSDIHTGSTLKKAQHSELQHKRRTHTATLWWLMELENNTDNVRWNISSLWHHKGWSCSPVSKCPQGQKLQWSF